MSSNLTLPSPMVRINRRCLSMEYLTFISVQFECAHRWTLAKLSHRFGDLTGDKRGLWKVDSRGPQPIGNGTKAHISFPTPAIASLRPIHERGVSRQLDA